MVLLLSGITKSSSMPITLPYPSHRGHAPSGLLKLKRCSEGCSNWMPSASKRDENSVAPLSVMTVQIPSP